MFLLCADPAVGPRYADPATPCPGIHPFDPVYHSSARESRPIVRCVLVLFLTKRHVKRYPFHTNSVPVTACNNMLCTDRRDGSDRVHESCWKRAR